MPDLRAIREQSFRAFVEANGRLSKEELRARFPGPFLVTEASTDPATWTRARLLHLGGRGPRLAIEASLPSAADARTEAAVDDVVVGRLSTCDVVIPMPSVSKRHARIWRRDRTWWIADLGSANGTSLDGADLVPDRPSRIARSPARLAFGSDVVFTFFTTETLAEFLERIRAASGAEQPPALLPDDDGGPAAAPEDFASLQGISVSAEDASSRVAWADAEPLPLLPTFSPQELADTDCKGTDVGPDERRLDETLRALAAMSAVLARVEVDLDTGVAPLVVLEGGAPDPGEHVLAILAALRPRLVAVRVTLSIGDRRPFELFRRR